MRVLWISHLLPWPPVGGNMQRSYNLLKQAARRHELHLAALVPRATHPSNSEREAALKHLRGFCMNVTAHRIPSEKTRLHWWALVACSYFSELPYDVNWLRSDALAASLRATICSRHFDLVHVDTLGMAQYARVFRNVPWVLTHHNVESAMMGQRAASQKSWPKRSYFRREATKLRRYERLLARQTALHIVVSDLDACRLRSVAGDVPITTVPNGVDTEYFSPGAEVAQTPGHLIFVGGMNSYANRDGILYFLSDVWPRLRAMELEFHLTVVGRDPPSALRRSAKRSDRITAPGFVEDVRPLMDAAEIYVCPIRCGGGTRVKVLDALAMAKPLVATRFAVEGLGLKEGTHYLAADSGQEFALQLKRLRLDGGLRRHLSHHGRKLVEGRYSWEAIGRRLEEAYWRAKGDAGERTAR